MRGGRGGGWWRGFCLRVGEGGSLRLLLDLSGGRWVENDEVEDEDVYGEVE